MQAKVIRATGDLVSLATGRIIALISALAHGAIILLLVDPVGLTLGTRC
jgi:hypothetical protein